MEKIKRVVIDLPVKEHAKVKSKAASVGLSMKEIARRLLFAWLREEIKLPEK